MFTNPISPIQINRKEKNNTKKQAFIFFILIEIITHLYYRSNVFYVNEISEAIQWSRLHHHHLPNLTVIKVE